MEIKTLFKHQILSQNSVRIILYLYYNLNKQDKKMSGYKAARELKCGLGVFYTICELLIKNSLVEKERQDKRSYSWKLTDKGIRLAEGIIKLKRLLQ